MKDERLREALACMCEDLGLEEAEQPLILDSAYYDKSIVGITEGNRLVYSLSSMVAEYMEDEGCTEEEAIEWIEYNTIRALPYAGDMAPLIIRDTKDEIIDRYLASQGDDGGVSDETRRYPPLVRLERNGDKVYYRAWFAEFPNMIGGVGDDVQSAIQAAYSMLEAEIGYRRSEGLEVPEVRIIDL